MHTVLKSLRNAKSVENIYEALNELSKKHDNYVSYRMPTSVLEDTRADIIVPHADIQLERLNTDLKYELMEIKKGTILGLYPGDLFLPNSNKIAVTPYYSTNGIREILSRHQFRNKSNKHRIYNIELYSQKYLNS